MEKEFSEDLKDVYKNNLFDNEVMKYYLNGFIDALGIDISSLAVTPLGFSKITDDDGTEYVSDKVRFLGNDLKINVSKNDSKKKSVLEIYGKFHEMFFRLNLIYSRHKLAINKLDYQTEIRVMDDSCRYLMQATNDFYNDYRHFNHFIFQSKVKDFDQNMMIRFGIHRDDFENVLGVIMSFLENPEYVMKSYYKKANEEEFFNHTELENDLMVTIDGKAYQKVR